VNEETRLQISAGEVHLFSTSLDDWQPHTFSGLLTDDEIVRSDRFKFDRDRHRYIVGRGLLRCVLAGYFGRDPAALRFRYTQYGKPLLDDPRLSFNLSHSEDRALFAVAPGFEVGVDVEVMNSSLADEAVAERFFTRREVADLNAVSPGDRTRAFLTCWTRKEAYIKARGEGLSLPLHEFDVTLRPGEEPRLRWTAWSSSEPRTWRLVDVSAEEGGYVAAVAARSPSVGIRRCDFAAVATPACRQ
jgi:4'-phosphopantetheinyl transferase